MFDEWTGAFTTTYNAGCYEIKAQKTCFCSGLSVLHCWAIFLMTSTDLKSENKIEFFRNSIVKVMRFVSRTRSTGSQLQGLPGNCLDTIGCCWRTNLMYPFRGLFGGPLGWELRYFTVLTYVGGRTRVHLQHTHTQTSQGTFYL